MKVQERAQKASRKVLRIFSFQTCLVLCLSILFSLLGSLAGILIQTIASALIVLGVLFELLQVLMVIQMADREGRIGWVLHRFSYATLLTMVLSFVMIVVTRFLSSFSISSVNLMIIAVMAYTVQASFGIFLSVMSYHFLVEGDAWRLPVEPSGESNQS